MINVIELFAGVGGFRLGLQNTGGFRVIWGNQWEPSKKAQDAYECYSKNFSHDNTNHSNEDISKVLIEDIPDADLLVGGFPCQDYSVARSLSQEKGIEGKKGVLFWEIVRIIEAKQPKYVLLENVDRLLKSPSKQRGRDFSIMLASFRDMGYNVEWRVINAADYGEGQRRRRIFIFAYKQEIAYGLEKRYEDCSNILHQSGFFAKSFPVLDESSDKHPSIEFELPCDILEVSETFSASYRNSGVMINGRVYSEELVPRSVPPIVLGDIVEEGVDEKYYLTSEAIEKFAYLKGPKKIERTSKSGHTYIFSEGGMSFPEPLNSPGRTMLTSEGSINRSTHVIKDPGTNRVRILTPVECERLNGFPDNWTNTGMSERMRYFCMGNALVVNLITKMGERIIEIDSSKITEEDSNIKSTIKI